MEAQYDVLIVGGGLVGASLACALGQTPLRVGLVEALPLRAPSEPSYDERVIALSWGSRRIFEGLGLWSALAPEAEPIQSVHISDRGHFGFARLHCEDQGTEALGYVVPARAIGQTLYQGLRDLGGLSLFCPARLGEYRVEADRVLVGLDREGQSQSQSTRLLVAADGGDSAIRRRLGLGLWEWDYGHTAVIATLSPERPRPGVAFERFTDTGPLALLPMTGGRYSLVWTARDGDAPALLALPEGAFLARLQERFGYRLGRLGRLGRRAAYPLRLVRVKHPVAERIALIGNAAHTLHPVAGQGFNLGLRDVAVLAQVLAEGGQDPGAREVLERFANLRRSDLRTTALLTDALARGFANPLAPLVALRNLGLLALDLLPAPKSALARRLMGLGEPMSRLSRGLPLVARR